MTGSMILAIDTATQYASLALYSAGGIVAEEYWFSGRNHTVELPARIARMLTKAGTSVSQLTALAVALGPGSFTGLRIGLAITKGLALPYKLPVIGVPTLDIAAQPFVESRLPVWTVGQAGRGRIFAACYSKRKDVWQVVIEPYITNLGDLSKRITRASLVTGELDQESIFLLQRNGKVRIASAAERVRRAAYLAELAFDRLEAGAQDDPDALIPIYLTTP